MGTIIRLKYLNKNTLEGSTILENFLNVSKAIRNKIPNHSMVLNIYITLIQLSASDEVITMAWVPGHTGISIDEWENETVKRAATSRTNV